MVQLELNEMRLNVWLLPLATVLNVFAFAMLTPQVVVALSEDGVTAFEIALFGSTPFLAILIATPLVNRLLGGIGLKWGHSCGLGLSMIALFSLSLLLAKGLHNLPIYLILSFLSGLAAALHGTLLKSLLRKIQMNQKYTLQQPYINSYWDLHLFWDQLRHPFLI